MQPKLIDCDNEIIVDLFAGGGGASSGIEEALGRVVDVAINHDAAAIAMHQANHPQTHHFTSNIWDVDPRRVTSMFGNRPVGFLWASPDCTTFSKAKGAAPFRDKHKKSRSLGWVLRWWAGTVRPRVIHCENVEEWAMWGPTFRGRKGRMRKAKGRRFQVLVQSLREMGYAVEWRELRASGYGAATIRKRLYLIARCDGQPIVWPEVSHIAPAKAGKTDEDRASFFRSHPHIKPQDVTANHIDWSQPMCSIFATKDEAKLWAKEHGQACPVRPLAFNTNRRIARGVKRFVIDNPNPYLRRIFADGTSAPFTVQAAHGEESAKGSRWGQGVRSVNEPHTTVACSNDTGVVAPMLVPVTHEGDRRTPGVDEPLGTITCAHRGEFAVSSGFLVPRYGERAGQEPRSRSLEEPSATVVPSANGDQLIGVSLAKLRGTSSDANPAEPLDTISAGGLHHTVVASHMSAFLAQNNEGFYKGDGRSVEEPNGTICANGSLQSLVGVHMTHANTGHTPNSAADEPLHTVVADGARHSVVASHIQRDFGQSVGSPVDDPIGAITADRGGHAALVTTHAQRGQSWLSQAAKVYSFLELHYGTGESKSIDEPLPTVTTHDRFGLVNIYVDGEPWIIWDIRMRMLQPRELFSCQGFRKDYIIDVEITVTQKNGRIVRRWLTKTEQVRMVGNSVSPPVAAALVRANCPDMAIRKAA